MHRILIASGILAGFILPLSAQDGPVVWAPNAQEPDGECFRRIAACVENCGPVDDKSDDNCIDTCLRADVCDIGRHGSSRSNLPDDQLPVSSLPDSRLPGDKLPDSRLP